MQGYREGRFPKPSHWNPRCPNKVRYEMLTRLGYFVTESSEHFAEYTPWFIKRDRPDLIEKFGIPLDEYPVRCIEQIARWKKEAEALKTANTIEVKESHEYASQIVNSVVTGEPSVIYGNHGNKGYIPQLPDGCAVEVPTLVDHMGLQPTVVHGHPAAADRADADQHQRAGPDGAGAADRKPRAYLSRGDAGPAHRRPSWTSTRSGS